ncbi:MAG: peptide deformylase [Phycisphaeraceae bacterium]|nr:peptide deformylase [Phycisphaeraceae bacterium]
MPTPDPSNLYIRTYPDPALRRRAQAIDPADEAIGPVAERMIELMFDAAGIGLAAPQVGLPWRLFVAHVPHSDEDPEVEGLVTSTTSPLVFINPEVLRMEGAPEPFEEGCLSLPDIRADVLRPPVVHLRAYGIGGDAFEIAARGLLARCLLHEFDHLDGVMIIDKFTQIGRMKTKSAVRRLEREAGVR